MRMEHRGDSCHQIGPSGFRVLQVITPSHMSGAEIQLVRMQRRMQARGHQLPIVIKRGSPAIQDFAARGATIDPRPIRGKFNPLALAALAKACADYRPDIVQSALSTASWWCGWYERLGGPKTIGHVHGFTSARWHRNQTHLLAVSAAVKQHLVGQGIDAEKITVLHNAIGPDEFVPSRDPAIVRSEMGAEKHSFVVGTFAHLSEKKGHRELFDAIPEILREVPEAEFWIVGRGGLRAELEAIARRRGFRRHVKFTGFRRDAADLMNAIDVFALPSRREPFGLVYIEAALLEKPTIACRGGGAPESIADGETGLLVPPRDSQALAGAVVEIATNRDRAAAMGRAGRERALDCFSWQRFAKTLEGVYEQVCGAGRTNRQDRSETDSGKRPWLRAS